MTAKGFTLIEMLMVVAVMALIVGIAAPVLQSFQLTSNTTLASTSFVQSLRRAYTRARIGDGRSVWGVKVVTSTFVIFKGSSYSVRDSSFDEFVDFSTGVSVSGTTEYAFSLFSGAPSSAGTTTFFSRQNDLKTVVVNSAGIVSH